MTSDTLLDNNSQLVICTRNTPSMKFLFTALLFITAYNAAYGWSDPFNQEEGKCGCCPLPCCCKCIEKEEPAPVQPECPSAEPPIVECESLINIGFLVDVSASIDYENLPKVQSFLGKIVDSLSDESLTALVSYESNATIEYTFADPEASDKALAKAAIGGLTLGKFTNVVEGMEKMVKVVDTVPDENVPRAFIVLSDGRSMVRESEVPAMAAELKAKGTVAVVGVTDLIFPQELETISSSGTFTFVDNFDGLKTILNNIILEVCETVYVPTTPPCPTAPPVKVDDICFCCCPTPYPIGPPGSGYC